LFEIFLEPQILFDDFGIAFSFNVDSLKKPIDGSATGIGNYHPNPQCRHTEMQAVDNVGTAMFVGEIKAELHRHPF
jgi:hypothetical protein